MAATDSTAGLGRKGSTQGLVTNFPAQIKEDREGALSLFLHVPSIASIVAASQKHSQPSRCGPEHYQTPLWCPGLGEIPLCPISSDTFATLVSTALFPFPTTPSLLFLAGRYTLGCRTGSSQV